MWRKASKFEISRGIRISKELKPTSHVTRLKESSHDSTKIRHFLGQNGVNPRLPLMGFGRNVESSSQMNEMGSFNFMFSANPFGISGFYNQPMCYYATAAEAIATASSEDDDEIRELVDEIDKLEREKPQQPRRKEPSNLIGGMTVGRYNALRKRQVKIETEAWNEAAKEYQELLADMCEQKLAPNLPYMKSLFLGWFEPLKDAIKAEQEANKTMKHKAMYAPCFDQLPADMMAVITMHKLMGLLMTGTGNGSTTVVQAACQIGEAIEQEVRRNALFLQLFNVLISHVLVTFWIVLKCYL